MRDIKDYTDKYVDEPFEATMVEIRKHVVIDHYRKYRHENILEIGCGMNPFFLDVDDFENMVIVEPGESFVDNAHKLAMEQKGNIHIFSGFLEEQVQNIQSLGIHFDYIILSSVLHELDDPQKMLHAIHQLCGKDTIVHINVPNANSVHRLIAIEMGLIEDIHEQSDQMKKMQRRRTYDMDLLKEEVERAGFTITDSGSYFVKPFTHLQMQKCLDMGIIDEKVLVGLEKLIKYIPQFGAGIYVDVQRV